MQAPGLTRRGLLTDSFERAMRPPAEGGRRLRSLGSYIEIIPRLESADLPPPAVFDEAFDPRR